MSIPIPFPSCVWKSIFIHIQEKYHLLSLHVNTDNVPSKDQGRYLVDTIVTIAFFRCEVGVFATFAVTHDADGFARLPIFRFCSIRGIQLGYAAVLCQSTTTQTHTTFQSSDYSQKYDQEVAGRDVRTRQRRVRKLFAASADGSHLKIRGCGLTRIINSSSSLSKLTRRTQ